MQLKSCAKVGHGPWEPVTDKYGNDKYSNIESSLPQYWPVGITKKHHIGDTHLGWMKDNPSLSYNRVTSLHYFRTR